MSKLSERLLKFNKGLLTDMVQLKYKLMSENAFRFFRGTCHLFYEDLSKVQEFPVSPPTWICGDLHLENFGSFKGNNRMVYFDLNDFDEAILAPLCWEVSRTLTSIFVAFNALKIKPAEAKKAAKLFLKIYSEVLTGGKAYYIDPRTATGIVKSFMKAVKKRTEDELIQHLCETKDSSFKIAIDNKTHFKVDKALKAELEQKIPTWIKNARDLSKNYTVKDVAFRVAGTGSVGLKRYMFLLQHNKDKKKLVIVEMKQTRSSALSPYVSIKQPVWKSEAERLIFIKQKMQNISPALLSAINFQGDTYVFQEMQPTADKIKFELIEENDNKLERVIKDMAMLTASSQIRSGGIQGSSIIDELVAFGGQKDWQEALLTYAMNYSSQVADDYNQFLSDYNNGKFSPSDNEKPRKDIKSE
ncbi:Uncharacterized conserved protein, DUF2252 family [Mucilaginibacter mallensis]|uniref:Uncharacterized conserved protein, DUF2252 family n=1 Tax=Mucilaginibacter mallensis TaxID=652787 RepID=A0A1H1XZ37_MUCMA|nr:DUF2252 family protein [Mucilaginibacter mallensis]SDT14351.1 Uncharacterized conserved protein, DUF2252 family [Mucilaginibacter mallensis]